MFDLAMPIQHNHSYYEDDELGLYIGVWDTTDMVTTAGPYGCDEFMIVLEGQAAIKNIDTGELETVDAGEGFVIPKGYQCQWQQRGYLRKFYVISEHPNEKTPEQASVSSIVKIKQQTSKQVALDVELEGDAFDMASAKPVNKGQHLYQDNLGRFVAGIWQSDGLTTKRQAFPRNEFIYIHSGSLTCIDEHDNGHVFAAGDALFIPQGTICHWQINEPVCTYYAIIQ